MAPWYDYVEEYIGVSGENLGLPQYPSGKLLKPMELTCVENVLKETLAKKYDDRVLTIGRVAHITEGTKPGKGKSVLSIEIVVDEDVHTAHISAVIHQRFQLLKIQGT